MTCSKWLALVCLGALLFSPGCSSGSSGNNELNLIEQDLKTLLQIQAFIADALDPFGANPVPASGSRSGWVNSQPAASIRSASRVW